MCSRNFIPETTFDRSSPEKVLQICVLEEIKIEMVTKVVLLTLICAILLIESAFARGGGGGGGGKKYLHEDHFVLRNINRLPIIF